MKEDHGLIDVDVEKEGTLDSYSIYCNYTYSVHVIRIHLNR